MKIKLQDYSLISNEWIDKRIEFYTKYRDSITKSADDYHFYSMLVNELVELKQQLIPSEKLAMSCIDGGINILNANISDGNCRQDIQDFLTSEIELL